MENINKINRQIIPPFTLSKSRFKNLIDQIETQLKQPIILPKSHSLTSLIIKSSSKHSIEKNTILPSFFNNPIKRNKNKQNQKRISINLQFNKLILNKKNQFIEHSPNQKDLMIFLPELNIPLKSNQKAKKIPKLQKSSSRWRINPQITQSSMFLTQNQDLSPINEIKKFKKIDLDNLNVSSQQKLQNLKKHKHNQSQQKQNKKRKLKNTETSQRQNFCLPVKKILKDCKNQIKKEE